MVQDLDDALCEYNCCSGDVSKCPDYYQSKCGGEFGRVSLYNMMAAPVTIGLQAFLTDKDGLNVVIQYGKRIPTVKDLMLTVSMSRGVQQPDPARGDSRPTSYSRSCGQ